MWRRLGKGAPSCEMKRAGQLDAGPGGGEEGSRVGCGSDRLDINRAGGGNRAS